jgi:hypothetical protein
MKRTCGYRVEKMLGQPEELSGLPCPTAEWVLIRNHDDEPMAVYGSKREAMNAIRESEEYENRKLTPQEMANQIAIQKIISNYMDNKSLDGGKNEK